MKTIKQFPHCDPRILHAPTECEVCDRQPDWQDLREVWGINFTGHHDEDKIKCPAEQARDLETIEKWGGNVPYRKEEPTKFKKLNPELLEEVRKAIEEHNNPDPEKYCLKSRPQNKGMLGGPKYVCLMPKGHEGKCFQTQQWSPHC